MFTCRNVFQLVVVSVTFSLGGVFLFYAVMCAAAVAFVAMLVPETKNKSLEEISKELKSK